MYCPACRSIRVVINRERFFNGCAVLRSRVCRRCGLRFRTLEEIPDGRLVEVSGGEDLTPACPECGLAMRVVENLRRPARTIRTWICDSCWDAGKLSYLKTDERVVSVGDNFISFQEVTNATAKAF